VFAQTVVYGGYEAAPEPGVVFGGEIGRVVGELIFRWRREKDLEWIVAEYREELRAVVGREVERRRVGGMQGRRRER
jgi:hypothetical protein